MQWRICLVFLVKGIIGVTFSAISVESVSIVLVKRPAITKTFDQVRVGNKETAKTNHVTGSFSTVESTLNIIYSEKKSSVINESDC